MELVLSDFMTSYPDYVLDPEGLFAVYGQSELYDILQRKKEFSELALQEREERPKEKGGLLKHQKFIRRFLSGYTPYDSMLLWHDVGTGKTISSIAVAEGLKLDNPTFAKTLVICRGPTFVRNFKKELTKISDDYVPKVAIGRELTEQERIRRTNKLINAYYEITTFQVFSNQISTLMQYDEKNQTDRVGEQYSNRVIIIDEVHNLRSKLNGDDDTYGNIHKFLHRIKNNKIILLSATPVKDTVHEFGAIMNLILPMDKQLPEKKEFMKHFFPKGVFTNQQELIESVKGHVSYLRQTRSNLRVLQAGRVIDGVSVPLVLLPMSPEQNKIYLSSYAQDTNRKVEELQEHKRLIIEELEEDAPEEVLAENDDEEEDLSGNSVSGIYKLSRQASLFCYQNNEGKSIFGKDLTKSLSKRLSNLIEPSGQPNDMESKLNRLAIYSSKYHYLIKTILDHPREKFFVYCKFVSGSGIAVLNALLRIFGFDEASGNASQERQETTVKKRRFAEIQGETQEGNVERILDQFNRDDPSKTHHNLYGEYIQVVIGSSVLGEGRSLSSIRHIMIVTPHWNYTEIDQAIGRGIRFGSHDLLPIDQQTVTIHRLCVDSPHSIDIAMYEMAQKKDQATKQLEYLIRFSAVDCVNNKVRNTYPKELDGSRECLYQPCPYICMVEPDEQSEPIVDTYNLFYTEKEYREIVDFLKSLFRSKLQFSYRIEEFLSYPELARYSGIVLFRCLSSIISNHEQFHNPLGWESYLKEQRNEYYLSYDTISDSSSYDTKLGQLYPIRSFRDYLNDYQTTNLTDIMLRMKQELEQNHLEYANSMFKILEPSIQIQLLKQMMKKYSSAQTYPNLNEVGNPVENLIIRQMKTFIVARNGEYTVVEDQGDQVEMFVEQLKLKIKEGFLYYAYEDAKGELFISEIEKIPKSRFSGTACMNVKPDVLKTIFGNINQNHNELQYSSTTLKSNFCKSMKEWFDREGLLTTQAIHLEMKKNYKDGRL